MGHGSRAYEIRYHNWNMNMDVTDLSTGQPVYSLDGGCLGGTLTCVNNAGIVVGTGRTSLMKSNITVNMNAPGGDPKQNRDQAKAVREEMEQMMDQKMSEWSTNQMRPGGVLTRKGLSA